MQFVSATLKKSKITYLHLLGNNKLEHEKSHAGKPEQKVLDRVSSSLFLGESRTKQVLVCIQSSAGHPPGSVWGFASGVSAQLDRFLLK